HAHAHGVRVAAHDLEGDAVGREIIEIGAVGVADEILEGARADALGAQARTDAAHALVHQRLEDFFLALEVVVEGARREAGLADDVAHGSGTVAEIGEDGARGVEDRLAVVLLCELALARRLLRGVAGRRILDAGAQAPPPAPRGGFMFFVLPSAPRRTGAAPPLACRHPDSIPLSTLYPNDDKRQL